ncbi:MAG: 23S rRNA (adenine(2503)-C(2))-methyltransferase RlmN [Pirellulaceae bacterium]|nr:23S rRNA (adenine(2503)-C(2))-methyltransferase RlmN [Pirellulaceae bacterium]
MKTSSKEGTSLPSIHSKEAIENFRRKHRIDPHRIKRFRHRFYRQAASAELGAGELPKALQDSFLRHFSFHSIQLEKRLDSKKDGASKLLFRTSSNLLIESVILRASTGRTTLCLSSQVGCAANCRFCATGQMGIAKNLTTSEILDQLVWANQILADENRRVRNLVFMGMGEPLHNMPHLLGALALLTEDQYFAYAPQRILVSTVGILDEMIRLKEIYPQLGLAISLHQTDQAKREKLIPLAKRYPINALRATIEKLNALNRRPIMLEYLMIDQVTDQEADIESLLVFCQGLNVHLNLIPYNRTDHAPELRNSPRERATYFSRVLKKDGIPVTIRYSLGADIEAACGQLICTENRQIALEQLRLNGVSQVE